MANTTLNPSDKAVGVTLTGSNLIATNNNNVPSNARSVDKQIGGKFYWEYTYVTVAGAGSGAGLSSPTFALTSAVTATAGNIVGAVGLNRLGSVGVDGASALTGFGVIANGTVVCAAVDLTARLIWYRLGAAGTWNNNAANNPATGVGGIAITLGRGIPAYPTVSVVNTSDQITANFGDSAFTGAVPAGFTSGFTAGVTSPTNAIASQSALEQFLSTNPPAQVTQVTVEQWVTTATVTGQALVTQVALEQWVPAPKSTIDLIGNLGGVSHYGKLKYGKGHYSRIDAFAPIFAADITVVAPLNLSGDLAPTIVLAADLDVHVNLIDFAGDLAPQIDFNGALSLSLPLTALDGSFGFTVVYGALELISAPLWADSEPCPLTMWEPSEPCSVPPWMAAAPCEPVVWKKSVLCNG